MDNQQAYDVWANNYDTVINKTRDLEAFALREMLGKIDFETVLEIGCGTGKNTEWLLTKAKRVVGADFSEEMLAKAKAKIASQNVEFVKTDIRENWNFPIQNFDLITCSLALEHVEDLDFVFQQANLALKNGGLFYIGELHPFKQYQGSKARFYTNEGIYELECFVHHFSDFFKAAKDNDFSAAETKEWFDENNRNSAPRLLTMIFKKAF